jgi:hypothetical protein
VRMRLTKIDEYQLLLCIKHAIWGSKSSRFSDWYEGDKFAIIVDKSLAALAEVAGPPFESQDKVWDNGVFPYRVPLRFLHVLAPKHRPPILGDVRDALMKQWGTKYGFRILNQEVLESPGSDDVVKAFSAGPNALDDFQQTLSERLEEARLRRAQSAQVEKPRRGRPRKVPDQAPQRDVLEDRTESTKESSAHTKTQSELVMLGRITGSSVWIASNDQRRQYAGRSLAEDCLKKLPRMGLSDEAAKRISLIDVIWINQNSPAAAFEIETTTSIYSGLLRMSDLLSVVPALNIKIYIVAPRERQNKVLSELGRPTFRKIGLSEYCRYVSSEDLSDLLAKVKGFDGHIQPSILDKIAVSLEEEEGRESP